MNSKITNKPTPVFHGIDSNRRLTRLFRESLSSSWLHPYIRTRRFVQEYSWPVIMTGVFLILVFAAALLRVSQRSSLANLLASVTSAGQDYGTLLSQDKTEELKKNNDAQQSTTGTSPASPTAFSVSPNGNPAVTSNPSFPTNGGSPVAVVFNAAITSFQQDSVTLECTTPKPKLQTCSKRYVFSGGIRTSNGPGSVTYGWRSNLQTVVEDRTFSVGGGEVVTPVQKIITLPCTSASSFSLQLTLLSPSSTQSQVLNTNHNCGGI